MRQIYPRHLTLPPVLLAAVQGRKPSPDLLALFEQDVSEYVERQEHYILSIAMHDAPTNEAAARRSIHQKFQDRDRLRDWVNNPRSTWIGADVWYADVTGTERHTYSLALPAHFGDQSRTRLFELQAEQDMGICDVTYDRPVISNVRSRDVLVPALGENLTHPGLMYLFGGYHTDIQGFAFAPDVTPDDAETQIQAFLNGRLPNQPWLAQWIDVDGAYGYWQDLPNVFARDTAPLPQVP